MNATMMSHWLEGLGRVSGQAAVLVLLVLLVQWLCRSRLTPRWRWALWLLVVGRLLLPASLPPPWSLFNLFPAPMPGTESVATLRRPAPWEEATGELEPGIAERSALAAPASLGERQGQNRTPGNMTATAPPANTPAPSVAAKGAGAGAGVGVSTSGWPRVG